MISHTTKVTSGYSNIDIAKFICSFLVVLIHTSPFIALSDIADFYTADVLARIAVPLFYSISGFLFFSKLKFENGKIQKSSANHSRMIRYWKSSAVLYFGWSVAYIVLIQIPMWYRTGWWGVHVIKDCLFSVLFSGSYYHLWYLLTLVYAIPLLYLVLQHVHWRVMALVSVFLWLGECLVYSYSWIGIDGISIVQFISVRFPILFDTVFRAIPLLFVGLIPSQWKPRWNDRNKILLGLLSFIFFVIEASVLYFFIPGTDKYSYLISTPLLAFFWLLILVTCKQATLPANYMALLRNSSLVIYCLHPMILCLLHDLGINSHIVLFILAFGLSFGVSYMWIVISKKLYLPARKNPNTTNISK